MKVMCLIDLETDDILRDKRPNIDEQDCRGHQEEYSRVATQTQLKAYLCCTGVPNVLKLSLPNFYFRTSRLPLPVSVPRVK